MSEVSPDSEQIAANGLDDCDCGLDALRVIRAIRGLSLNEAARKASISPAYLQKLERGEVKDPSPRILYRLSEALDFPYTKLMQHAGYVVPGQEDLPTSDHLAVLADAIGSTPLTQEERDIIAITLGEYRKAHDAGVEIGSQLIGATIREIRHVQERRQQADETTTDLSAEAFSVS